MGDNSGRNTLFKYREDMSCSELVEAIFVMDGLPEIGGILTPHNHPKSTNHHPIQVYSSMGVFDQEVSFLYLLLIF